MTYSETSSIFWGLGFVVLLALANMLRELQKNKLGSYSTAMWVCRHYGCDLSGKVAIVTGSNTGIGKPTAEALVAHNATVILACRSETKALAAVKDIKNATGKKNVEYMHLDLGDMNSIRKFVEDFLAKKLPLHMLINNAGVLCKKYETTKDGIESQWGISYIGHYLLTNLLLDKLRQSGPSRIVFVSSMANLYAKFESLDAIIPPKDIKTQRAMTHYTTAKFCQVAYANALHRRLSEEKSDVTVYSVHPGVIKTKIMKGFDDIWYIRFGLMLAAPFRKSVYQGAATSVYCAVSPDAKKNGGEYFSNCAPDKSHPKALDHDLQQKLIKISEEIIHKND